MNMKPSAEELLNDTHWLKHLACQLVQDENSADDLIQEAWIGFMKTPPERARRSWFSSVLRNLSAMKHREEKARKQREKRVARRERTDTTPDQTVEQLELQQRLVGCVLELDEPLRSTVVLRFFDELRTETIAQKHGVAITTVRARLQRAFTKLRNRLDDHHGGDRRAWLSIIAPVEVMQLATGKTAATTAMSAGKVATESITLLTGGVVMTTKVTFLVVSAGALSLVIGLGIGNSTSSLSKEEAMATFGLVRSDEYTKLESRYERTTAHLISERDALRARVASLSESNREFLARLEEKPVEVEASVDSASKVALEAGGVLELDSHARLVQHFKEFGSRLAAAIENGPEERDSRFKEALLALDRLNSAARETSLAAFFDEDLLVAATNGILADALGLNDEQVEELETVTRAALESTLDKDLTDLVPFERQELRESVASSLLDSTQELLYGESLERWNKVEAFVRKIFTGDPEVHVSGSNYKKLEFHIAKIWKKEFGMGSDQDDLLAFYAEGFAQDAQSVLARVGSSSPEFEALDDETRVRVEKDFRDLQVRYERDILATLSPEQREAMLSATPACLRLRPGDSCDYHEAGIGLFSPGQ